MRLLLFVVLMLPVAWCDYKYGLIFNRWNIVIFIAGLLAGNDISFSGIVLAALAGAGSLLVLRLVSRGGIGWGDIKLLLALSPWLTWEQQLMTLLFSFWLGGAYGGWLLFKGKAKLRAAVPFGPFLAAGACASFVYGQKIMSWYMGYFYG